MALANGARAKTKRVLLAESAKIVRATVRAVIERHDFEVLEAHDLRSAVEATRSQRPDIALVDRDLPPAGGIAAASELARTRETAVIVWGTAAGTDEVVAAVRAGAIGFLEKDVAPSALVRTLRMTLRGEGPITREGARAVAGALYDLEERGRAQLRLAELSRREREVLGLVASGLPNRQIAVRLMLSEATVKRHVHNILAKLDVDTRRGAAAYAQYLDAAQATPNARLQ